MTVCTGDEVVLSDGGKSNCFVVLGFTKFHVSLATLKDYKHSVERHGKYCRITYGYASFPLRTSGTQIGFWQLLKSVNGKQNS